MLAGMASAGVGQRGQRVPGGQHLERLRVQHGCAELAGQCRGRAARLPFLHADQRCSLCGTEPDECARTGEEDPLFRGAEQLFVQQPGWRWACRLDPTFTTPLASHSAVSVRSGPVSLALTALMACCLASTVFIGMGTGTM